MIIINLNSLSNSNKKDYPSNAVKEVRGHISQYKDTFWYTDSSQKYEFSFEDYGVDSSYEPGEIINIYLDENSNVISISHKKEDVAFFWNTILMFVIPLTLLFIHAFVGKATYVKDWHLYAQWYKKEIAPAKHLENFDEIVVNKKYYDVTVKLRDLSLENQKLYKKYLTKSIIYSILLVICIGLTIYFCIEFDLNPNSWLIYGIVIVYVLIFYILITICEESMSEIKSNHFDKHKN